jgi:hypothetical protein
VRIVEGMAAYLFLLAVVLVDVWLLYRFFAAGSRFDMPPAAPADRNAEESTVLPH